MTDVFVSYKAEDRERIAPLVRALEADGMSVWWDAHIDGGDSWRDTILRQLESAKCVLVVWSRRSVGPKGEFVRDEATRAVKRKTYFPVRLDKVDPPLGFGETQALDFIGWKGDPADPRYDAVLLALQRRFGIRSERAGARGIVRSRFDRRAVLAGSAAAALAVAGGGAWMFANSHRPREQDVAVLPFENLSGDASQAYFSDGIAEELRDALSKTGGLRVVARTSSEAVRNEDAATAARQLGVSHILTGSVRRSATLLRISAQLVDADGLEQWSDTYDRPTGDALTIQADIAAKVVDALRIRLGALDKRGATDNAAAQDFVLKAQAMLRTGDPQSGADQALTLVDSSLLLDPRYSDALTLKAEALTVQAGMASASAAQSQQRYALAKAATEDAIRIAPRSRRAYAALANILDQQLQFKAALQQYAQMANFPGNDGDLVYYAVNLSEFRRSNEALAMIDRAIAADPLNGQAYGWRAYILANARRYADAAAAVRPMLARDPQSVWARSFHAYCLMMVGNNTAARREFDAIGSDAVTGAPAYVGAFAARQGDAELTARVVDHLRAHYGDATYYQLAEVYAQNAKSEEALDALQKAVVARDPGLGEMLVDPLLDPLRQDPRFKAILKSLDFPA